ncbi:maleylacetate reductase [Actinomadura bangladeshensis]|uniref:Maleylacetate reductase n=1 Tax=Actinomadura bangladeshensis TaxID=453573 RepID=A0A4R4PCB9_9ACTN|nr:maleylacetate reductase [Actinomadura bangladeshensis]TDC18683.1 maleylacetate reductase [Actinomadura bangladeshensis]
MDALRFAYRPLPVRVVFGDGVLAGLPAEVDALGLSRVLVLSTPGRRADAGRAASPLGARVAGVHAGAVMHVPAEAAAEACRVAGTLGADGLLAFGGGSAVGLAKAVARETGLPIVAVPTTYSGSEMTPTWGMTEDGVKRTGRDERVLARTVLYDPSLTLGLPAAVSAASAMNATAHAVEALYAPDASPIVSLMAEEAVRALAGALPEVVRNPGGLPARTRALYGAWLCGTCLGATTMGLHHKLCHILGGSLNLPHAETHAVLLPHALAYNAPAAPDAVAALRRALGRDDPARALWDLSGSLGLPRSLKDLGADPAHLDDVVARAAAGGFANPRPPEEAGLRVLLRDAWEGRPPAAS